MSLAINVYCKKVSKEMIPIIMKRLNDYDMIASVHPDFTFDEEADSGFLPFKFKLRNPHHKVLNGKELKSGFELYISQFDLAIEKENLKPTLNFFEKLIGKKQHDVPYATPEIEARLKDCKIMVSFVWHASDTFASRFASLTSAILSELTNGVCTYEDETWYDNKNIVENAFQEIREFEMSIDEKDLDYNEFDVW